MAVLSYQEIIPRTFQHRFGESPTAERRFSISVDGPTEHQVILNTVGIFHGASHPEYNYLYCTEGQVNEIDRHSVECVYRYESPRFDGQGGGEPQINPLIRRDVWTFSTGGAQVPAMRYYHGTGNGDMRPLINAAHDYIEGLTTLEAEVRATIAGNRATFPAALAASVTNSTNESPYLWGATHTWFCQGISASPQSEVIAGLTVNYWAITVELVYRASGFNLVLPHVGFNRIEGGNKKPCVVKAPDSDEEIVASTPQALNENGTQKYPPGTTPSFPDLLTRRVYPEVNFTEFFGTPQF